MTDNVKQIDESTTSKDKIRLTLTKVGGEAVVQRERSYHGGHEWKILGTPFSGTFGTGDQQRSMIVALGLVIRAFNSAGWKLGEGGK